jgi:hypothetical protein
MLSPAKIRGKNVLEFASVALLYTVNFVVCQSAVVRGKIGVRPKSEMEAKQ